MRFTQYRDDLRMRGQNAVLWHGDDKWSDAYDIIERIRRTGRLDVAEDLIPDDSDDSWNKFASVAPAMASGYIGGPPAAGVLQEQWERDRRARQLTKQQQSDQEWDDEETRLAKEKAKAEASAKRKQTLEANRKRREEQEQRAVELRRQWEEREAQRHQQYRDTWVARLNEAADSIRDKPQYAQLLADLEVDIGTIRDHPAGPLPWRFDERIFVKGFERRMAEIDGA